MAEEIVHDVLFNKNKGSRQHALHNSVTLQIMNNDKLAEK
jgi:hypothetical protein